MLLKFAVRNILKRPFLNLVKVVGLSLGLIGVLFISLFLKNEMSYDGFHKKADHIFRLTTTNPEMLDNNHFARIYNSEQVPDLVNQIPEIEKFVRLAPIRGGLVLHGEQYYSITEAFSCDNTFFEIFDAELLRGDRSSVLTNPGTMVVSESFARKVFGNSNPIDQIISLPAGQFNSEKADFTIIGVMRDFPQNSHFHPDFIISPGKDKIEGWAYTYLLLGQNANVPIITSSLSQLMTERSGNEADSKETKAYLQNIKEIHLSSHLLREIELNGNMANIYALSIAALILLFISISNYASLNLAMAGFFKKFIALNQVLGSSKLVNLKYFMIESLVVVLLAIAIMAVLVGKINDIILDYYQIDLLLGNEMFALGIVLVFGFMAVISGLQPAIKNRIGQFKLGRSLREKGNTNSHKRILIAQYSLTMILLMVVIIISRQTEFALDHSMDSEDKNIICIESVHSDIQKEFKVFKSELLKQNAIVSVSAMLDPPGGETHDMFSFEMEGRPNDKENTKSIGVFPCDYSLANLFELTFLSGVNFSEKNTDNDGAGEYIINETALHYLGFHNPNEVVDKEFKIVSPVEGVDLPDGKIIGVVKDFHLSGVQTKVEPLVMFKREDSWLPNIVVSYRPQMERIALDDIQKIWSGLFPKYPLSYEHVNTMYRKVYKTELLQAKLLTLFTMISLFICSMGLLGISLLIAQRKVKEISIRKVNGAKISQIIVMLNKDFLKWVAIAFLFATPVAYYAMYMWLQGFAYKINLSWWVFALAGGITLLITLMTVSWQSWKAATANPSDALRID